MTLEEQLAELRKKTGRVGFMPQSTEGATQRALEGAGQRPPLPEGRIPSASVMDPQGFQGIKGYDPTRLARRGASYLWEGPEGVAAFDEAEYQRTGKVSGAMDQRQGIEDIRNLYNQTPLVPAASGAQVQPAAGPVSATVDEVLAGQGGQQSRTGIFQGGQELTREQLGTTTQAPLQSGEIQTPDFRGTLEDYRAFRQSQDQERQAGIERNRESFRGAIGGAPTETAAQMGDKREMDRRMALIETMADGPEKQDALARIQDEATAKREAGVKDSDRFTGSIGSPDHKAREGRMAAYQARIKELSDSRSITKRNAEVIMKQEREIQGKLDIAEATQEMKRQEQRVMEQQELDGEDTKHIKPAFVGMRSAFAGKDGDKFRVMFDQMDDGERDDIVRDTADILASKTNKSSEADAFRQALTMSTKRKQREAKRRQSA